MPGQDSMPPCAQVLDLKVQVGRQRDPLAASNLVEEEAVVVEVTIRIPRVVDQDLRIRNVERPIHD